MDLGGMDRQVIDGLLEDYGDPAATAPLAAGLAALDLHQVYDRGLEAVLAGIAATITQAP